MVNPTPRSTASASIGTLPFLRGYADYATGNTRDYASVPGLPFEASDYYEGYALASYELGNFTTTEEKVGAR